MQSDKVKLRNELANSIDIIRKKVIPEDRIEVLKPLMEYIQNKINQGKEVHLNFICTHNSRRSQFAQIWAQTAADLFDIPVKCFSGGVEVTAFNENAVESLKRNGFGINSSGGVNPIYHVSHSEHMEPIRAFSKHYDDPFNNTNSFAAVMTCSHADENCPFIPGAEKRFSVQFDDPKIFDDTPQVAAKYDERSAQIASEMFQIFSNIKYYKK